MPCEKGREITMSKKILALLLALVCLFSSTALAEGKLKATEKNLIVFPEEGTGYFFAKVENAGDAAIGVGSGDFVVFSDDDEILLSQSYVSTIPSYVILEPGEYLYINNFLWDSALEGAVIGDYKFSISGTEYNETLTRFPCEATFDFPGAGTYENYIYVTFTNTTTAPALDCYAIAALYDTEGNLIYVDSINLDDIAVHPGSSVTALLYVNDDLLEYYNANGITPATVDAIVCLVNE